MKFFRNSANTAPLLVLSVFVLLFLCRLIDTTMLTRENEYIAVIVLELLVFLVPSAVYIRLFSKGFGAFRIKLFGLGHLLLILSAIVTLTTGTILIDYLVSGHEAFENSYDLWGVFISKNDGGAADTVYIVLAYAALPALCEEFLFRGILVSEYEKRSTTAAVLLSSVFFAMLHFDLSRFPTYFFGGVLLALTLYTTRSLAATTLVHFVYNLTAVFGRPYLQTVFDLGGEELFIFIITSLFLLFGGIFCGESARLYKHYAKLNLSSEYREVDPPYKAVDGGGVLEEFAFKHPRIAATAGAFFSFPTLVCYIMYTAAVFIGL